jgi:phytoene dehydrogenase-like protein
MRLRLGCLLDQLAKPPGIGQHQCTSMALHQARSLQRLQLTCYRFTADADACRDLANIARFSKKDAATFREWNRKGERITANIFLPERYSEPLPQTEREALLSRTMLGREFLAVTKRQPLDVVQELLENEHVRLLFLFKVSLFGTWLVDTLSTSPMGSVIRAFDLETGYQLCQGGSFNLARGLMETFIAAGGHYQPQVAIDRIIIEGGHTLVPPAMPAH